MLSVSSLYVYPVKSLGGIALSEAEVTGRGFKYDRRWMIVDRHNNFLSQREFARMAMLKSAFLNDRLVISNTRVADNPLEILLEAGDGEEMQVTVWGDECLAVSVSKLADQWFTDALHFPCRLVYMPLSTRRLVDRAYATHGEVTSFTDGYPFMMIGQASLDDLNSRMEVPLPMDRFRPSIVFSGGVPFQEDDMKEFRIGDVKFHVVKPCARCNITTIDQQTAVAAKEPLRTLAGYRLWENKVLFGQNLLHEGTGVIHVGDEVVLIR